MNPLEFLMSHAVVQSTPSGRFHGWVNNMAHRTYATGDSDHEVRALLRQQCCVHTEQLVRIYKLLNEC